MPYKSNDTIDIKSYICRRKLLKAVMAIGQKIIHLVSVDSTSNYAANLLKVGKLEHGTVILADEQYAGRGQRGTKWTSNPSDNLTFSFYLNDVNLAVDEQFKLTQLVSLGIVEFLKKFDVEGKIKWPNDIYVGDKKICGVLIENQLRGSLVKSAIVGVGLNVNQKNFNEGINATSLSELTGKHYVLMQTVLSFFHAMNSTFDLIKMNSDLLNEAYLKSMYRFEEWSHFQTGEVSFKGKIVGISPVGKLQVEDETSTISEYDLKEIRFVI